MSWGAPFARAWNAASDARKALAQQAATTAQSAWDAAKQKALKALHYGKEKAGEAHAWAKSKYGEAKEGFRDGVRNTADSALDKGSSALDRAGRTYDKARNYFGTETVGSPVQRCPGHTRDGNTNKSRDGLIMVPQGEGNPCLALMPGQGTLAVARAKAWINPDCPCERKSGQEPADIIFVNGIQNNQEEHCQALNRIAKQTCAKVTGVYNATEGFLQDGKQTADDRRLIKAASKSGIPRSVDGRNPAVDTMRGLITDEIEAGRKPEVWAHSQGAAIASLALIEAKNDLAVTSNNPDPLRGTKVKSFGGAAPQWTNGPAYEHFVHVNDPVPLSLGLGDDPKHDASMAGNGATVHRFSGKGTGDAPFISQNPDKSFLPFNLKNHSFTDSYLRMEKNINGGCK
jgi:hypothetical protein